jgi:hypothetical protein
MKIGNAFVRKLRRFKKRNANNSIGIFVLPLLVRDLLTVDSQLSIVVDVAP